MWQATHAVWTLGKCTDWLCGRERVRRLGAAHPTLGWKPHVWLAHTPPQRQRPSETPILSFLRRRESSLAFGTFWEEQPFAQPCRAGVGYKYPTYGLTAAGSLGCKPNIGGLCGCWVSTQATLLKNKFSDGLLSYRRPGFSPANPLLPAILPG